MNLELKKIYRVNGIEYSSLEEAKKAVPKDFSSANVDETNSYWRFRQRDPSDFIKSSFSLMYCSVSYNDINGNSLICILA